jgi:hypothetical protein
MDLLTFAFELARVGIGKVVIQYTRHEPWEQGERHQMCAVHAGSWTFAVPPSIETLVADAQRQAWEIDGVFGANEGVTCETCDLNRRVLATAHPVPWKQGDGNGESP